MSKSLECISSAVSVFYHKRFQLTISSGVIKNYMGRQVFIRDACTHVQNLVYYNYGNTKVWRELLNAELQIGGVYPPAAFGSRVDTGAGLCRHL